MVKSRIYNTTLYDGTDHGDHRSSQEYTILPFMMVQTMVITGAVKNIQYYTRVCTIIKGSIVYS
jgi:hypothetical protein